MEPTQLEPLVDEPLVAEPVSLQIKHVKKNKFVQAYKELRGNISACSALVGIERATYYNWLESDEEFARAIYDAEAATNDDIREKLLKQTDKENIAAIIFYLKNRHPDFKEGGDGENKTVNIQINNYNG